MIKEKNDSFKQLNFEEELPTRNTLSTLAPKQNDIKICDVMNKSIGCSPNRTKVNNPTDDILCTVNNNFVNTVNNESFNTINNFSTKTNPRLSLMYMKTIQILQILILP